MADPDRALITRVVENGNGLDKILDAGVSSETLASEDDIAVLCFLISGTEQHGKQPTSHTVREAFPDFLWLDSPEDFDVLLREWQLNHARRSTVTWIRDEIIKPAADPVRGDQVIERLPELLRAEADRVEKFASRNGHGRLVVKSSAEIKPETVSWTWEHNGIGWIPGSGLTVIVGDPGEGKGLLGCWIASHATRGSRGFPKMKVGILGHEDSAGIQVARLLAAGSDEVVFLDTADDNFMAFPTDVSLLRTAIEEHHLNLVLIDPINNHLDADIRTSDDKEMRRALSPLNKLGQELGVTIVAVTHMSKGTVGAKLLYRAGGSIAISGAARQMLFLGAKQPNGDEDQDFDPDERFLFTGKTNYSRKALDPLKFRIHERKVEVDAKFVDVPAMQFVGSDSGVSIEDVFSPPRGRGRPKDEGLREFIADLIEGKTEIPTSTLEAACYSAGRNWRVVKNLLSEEYGWSASRDKGKTSWTWRDRPSPFLKAVPGGGSDE